MYRLNRVTRKTIYGKGAGKKSQKIGGNVPMAAPSTTIADINAINITQNKILNDRIDMILKDVNDTPKVLIDEGAISTAKAAEEDQKRIEGSGIEHDNPEYEDEEFAGDPAEKLKEKLLNRFGYGS